MLLRWAAGWASGVSLVGPGLAWRFSSLLRLVDTNHKATAGRSQPNCGCHPKKVAQRGPKGREEAAWWRGECTGTLVRTRLASVCLAVRGAFVLLLDSLEGATTGLVGGLVELLLLGARVFDFCVCLCVGVRRTLARLGRAGGCLVVSGAIRLGLDSLEGVTTGLVIVLVELLGFGVLVFEVCVCAW